LQALDRENRCIEIVNTTLERAHSLCEKLQIGLAKHELAQVREYFQKLRREPTEIEIQTIAQTWSEHCFHKIFKSTIKIGNQKTINGIFRTFIARATEEIAADWVVSAFSDNAGIIKFDSSHWLAAKVETHNHPSAVEPFGGAATGVGGVIRDILGVWARPIANIDVLGFGPPDFPQHQLPPWTKHPTYLMKGVVAGIGNYGNNMGIPTVNGSVYFHDSYVGYALVFCGCIGLLQPRNYSARARPGDLLVVAGARTGRDGLRGVNFASTPLSKETDSLRSAVQIPDPIVEERLMRAILAVAERNLASAITDVGGGGLSSAVCETARRYSCGAEVDLDRIPLREESMIEPWEIWLSESQERMVLVVPKAKVSEAISTFQHEEIDAKVFGKLTESGEIVFKFDGDEIGRLSIDFLFSPPLPTLEVRSRSHSSITTRRKDSKLFATNDGLEADFLCLLASPNISSRESIVRTFDHEVGGRTVLKPFQYPNSGPNDAAVLKPVLSSYKGLAISCGLNPALGEIDPYAMAASSIDEAIRNNVCVGGRRIALLDNFAWGDPLKGENLLDLVEAAQACYDVAKGFSTPFISGKDSMYNVTPLGEITPTLVITAIGIVPNIRKCLSADFKTYGDSIYLVGRTRSELAGSEYARMKHKQQQQQQQQQQQLWVGEVPRLDVKFAKSLYSTMNKLTDQGFVKACHDISQGGLAVALAEMCFANCLGVDITLPVLRDESNDRILEPFELLFSESNSRFLIEVSAGEESKFQSMMGKLPFVKLGSIAGKKIVIRNSLGETIIGLDTVDCYNAWRKELMTISAS
jgi:phosphoribosylformylglycinamidine synthase